MKNEIIGNHTIYLGNALEIAHEVKSYDVVIADPPYEIPHKFGAVKTMMGTRKLQFDFDIEGITNNVIIPVLSTSLNQCRAFHIFCGAEQFYHISEIGRNLGFTCKPWAKIKACPPPALPGNWWPSAFELAIYGYKKKACFFDKNPSRRNAMVFDSYRNGIKKDEKVDHPTQKWLPMIRYLVETMTKEQEIVFDPFMGSGTTGVACENLGRKFIGIEINKKYFDISCKRIEQATKQQKLAPSKQEVAA